MNLIIGTMDMGIVEYKTFQYPPNRFMDKESILSLLRECLSHEPNDIHIHSDHPVIMEIDGAMIRATERPIDWSEFSAIADVLRQKDSATTILSQSQDYDGEFPMTDKDKVRRRLRVNMTGTTSVRNPQAAHIVLRPMQGKPPMPNEIGLDGPILQSLFPPKGAVYVIGPTGSGKTTTFASLFAYAALSGETPYHGHLATYESPPEYDLEGLSSPNLLITQTAIHAPWGLPDFATGIRNALRRHPCAVMIGEVRDLETVQAVVEAALTGHPVFGTVHADSPVVAFQRLLSRFPASQQSAGLYDLIMTTEVILAQRLVPRVGGGRIAVREYIVFNDMLRREMLQLGNPGEVAAMIARRTDEFGCSFSASARQLFDAGLIAEEDMMAIVNR